MKKSKLHLVFEQKIIFFFTFKFVLRYKKNKEVMKDLWDQIAEIADFDKVRDT